MSEPSNAPATHPTITIYQLRRDAKDVVISEDHLVVEEVDMIANDQALVEMSSDLFCSLLQAKIKVGEIALRRVLAVLGAHDLQVAKIDVTRKPETLTVRPVRRGP